MASVAKLHAEVGLSRRRRVLASVEGEGVGPSSFVQCEVKAEGTAGWDEAAWGIVEKLLEKDVRKGQILSIDAHSDGASPMMSAHYAKGLPDDGPLKLDFFGRAGITDSWAQIYRKASEDARGKDVISMTGSCEAGGTSAFYVFYNVESPANHTKVEYIECRAGSWNGAAKGLIKMLSEAGVKDGQLINIDAHNNGPNEAAMFSAFFCRGRLPRGDLKLTYASLNSAVPWEEMYGGMAKSVEVVQKDNLVGITGSCNMNKRVMYAFWQISAQSGAVEYLECRANSWNAAADGIIKKLKEAGVRRGQVLNIDAHNNGEDEKAIFSAHYLRSLQDRGELDIGYAAENSSSGWDYFYKAASAHAEGKDVISMTGSINTSDRSVFYVFFNTGSEARQDMGFAQGAQDKFLKGNCSSIDFLLLLAKPEKGILKHIES